MLSFCHRFVLFGVIKEGKQGVECEKISPSPMLISFSVANFRSFSTEETISLVASNRLSGSHEDHAVPIPGTKERVLRTSVLYGANGAGKSNLFKALKFVKQMATRTRSKNSGTGREAFRFKDETEEESSFDLQFVANQKLYRYGFKVDDERVTQEWLLEIQGEREKTLYERVTDLEDKVTVKAPAFKKSDDKVHLLAAIGGPHNQTFLATIRAILDSSSLNKDIAAVLAWFTDSLKLIAPNESIEPVGHMLSTDSGFLDFAGAFLKSSSTGVDHLDVDKVEISEDELAKLLPPSFMAKLLQDIGADEDGTAVVQYREGTELLIERKDANHFYRITIQASHKDEDGRLTQLSLAEESDGTRRLLQLMPALHLAKVDSPVYFVDEIDRSMHPMLVWKFLEFFMRSCCGTHSQIIVTTHESNLLDLELLRRDEIWFVEKDAGSSTRLYSLMDFKVRKDLEIRKHYLQGRFGAVPFLGNLERLLEIPLP